VVFSCKKDPNSTVPDIYVEFTIDINSTQYIDLNTVGGYVYVTGGINGIVIRRNEINEFVAFDRTCTYHVKENRQIFVEENGLYAGDTICGSRYLLLNGLPHEDGPSKAPLKQYRTSYDELTGYLRVSN